MTYNLFSTHGNIYLFRKLYKMDALLTMKCKSVKHTSITVYALMDYEDVK